MIQFSLTTIRWMYRGSTNDSRSACTFANSGEASAEDSDSSSSNQSRKAASSTASPMP